MLPAFFTGAAATGFGKVAGIFGAVVTLVAMVGNLFVKTINEGERGIRQRNGKPMVYKKSKYRRTGWRLHREGRWWRRARGEFVYAGDPRFEKPGTHLAFPIFFSLRTIDVKVTSTDLPPRVIVDASGVQRLIASSLEWSRGVTGPQLRQAELGVANELEMTLNRVGEALQYVIETLPKGPFPPSREIGARTLEECRDSILEDCGITAHRVLLTSVSLAPEQMHYDGMKLVADAIRERSPIEDDITPALPVVLSAR